MHVHTYIWERARMKTVHHRAGESTQGFRDNSVKGHKVAIGLGTGLCHPTASSGKSHFNSVVCSQNGALTGPVWDLSNKEMWKCFGNTCTSINGHYYRFIPKPRRVTFVWAGVACASQVESVLATGCFQQRKKGCGQFCREAVLFNFSIISKTKRQNLSPLLLFFQIKINYNPNMLINTGWSCP